MLSDKTDASHRPRPKFHWFVPIDADGKHIGTVITSLDGKIEEKSQV